MKESLFYYDYSGKSNLNFKHPGSGCPPQKKQVVIDTNLWFFITF